MNLLTTRRLYSHPLNDSQLYFERWRWIGVLRNVAVWDGHQWHQPNRQTMRSRQLLVEWMAGHVKGIWV